MNAMLLLCMLHDEAHQPKKKSLQRLRDLFNESAALIRSVRCSDFKFKKGDLGKIWRDTRRALGTGREWGIILAMTIFPYPGLPFITYGIYRVVLHKIAEKTANDNLPVAALDTAASLAPGISEAPKPGPASSLSNRKRPAP